MRSRYNRIVTLSMLAGFAVLLHGCARGPTLRASWYQQVNFIPGSAAEDKKEVKWYIALVNPGAKNVPLEELSLDSNKDGKGATNGPLAFTLIDGTTKMALNSGLTLTPGEIKVFELKQDPRFNCHVPIVIYVRTKEKPKLWPILLGNLPSFLSADQLKCQLK